MNEKNALISVYDKTGIVDFAKELIELGWKIWASGGTAKIISESGLAVSDVADLVGGGPILGHKVVTLSREIHAGLLADDSEQEELDSLKIPRIDLVVGGLYPLNEEIKKPDHSEESIRAQTDMGGPAMLRSAAKGRRFVLITKQDRDWFIEWSKQGCPDVEMQKKRLAANAEKYVSQYVASSGAFLDDKFEPRFYSRVAETAYGENRWQQTSHLSEDLSCDDPLSLVKFEQIEGSELSYNNYCDVDRLLQTITHIAAGFDVNFQNVPNIAVSGKHGNACGAAVSDDPQTALKKMLEGDLRAIFGGVIIVNFPIHEAEAEILIHHELEQGRRLLDVIVAPDIDEQAVDILARKKGKCRLLVNPQLSKINSTSLDKSFRTRYVRGGVLIQQNYDFVLNLNDPDIEASGEYSKQDVVLAWAIGSTSNSNTIALVKDSQLIGNGVGQQDRVGAAQLALKRAQDAKHSVVGATAFSDSFFPFPDGPMVLADEKVATIFATRGSVGDEVVKKALTDSGVTFVTLPDGVARGFYAH